MKKAKLITETSHDIEISESKKDKSFHIVGIFSSAERKNNNNRVYSRDILKREVDKVMEKIDNRCLWGELSHPSCVPGETEILTSDGWKEIKDISDNETIATLNTETNEIEYQQINHKISYDFDGKMINFKNRQMDAMFTPDHRFLMVSRYGKMYYATAEEIKERKTRKYDKSYIPKIGNWSVESQDFITIPGLEKEEIDGRRYKKDYSEDVEIDLNLFVSFLGIYLAEGWIGKGRNEYNTVNITQRKEDSKFEIEKMLQKFPEEMKWNKRDNSNGNTTFYLTDKRLAKLLIPLGKHDEKYIPKEMKNLEPKYLESLLYWFRLGDGRHSIKNGYECGDIFSTSEKLIDDFHEVCLKCGISARKHTEICEVDYKFAGRTIKSENKKPLHFLSILSTRGIYMDRRFVEISEVEYNDKVYCVQVDNGNFYMRNKNSVSFWTGNCPEINPDRIAILTESLEWRGNDLYGKAKVLDTPMGQILKTLVKEGKMGISSRGLGTVDENSGYVNEDYNLITWDVVVDPSNHPSWVNGIYEGKDFVIPEFDESKTLTEEEIKKAQEEYAKYLINLFEDMLK